MVETKGHTYLSKPKAFSCSGQSVKVVNVFKKILKFSQKNYFGYSDHQSDSQFCFFYFVCFCS